MVTFSIYTKTPYICEMSGQATNFEEAFWALHDYLNEHELNEIDVHIFISTAN